MAVVQRAVYRPRRPRESPLYRLVEDLFDTLVGVHEERFEPQYGRLSHAARRAPERFLDCGILDHGFARVVCERCKAEFLVAFSCKTRYLCPSCHAKRLEIWADWLEHELLFAVPHRQFVFTVPKRLRPFFLHDRRLLGLLSRVAYRTLRDFLRATFREQRREPSSFLPLRPHRLWIEGVVRRLDDALVVLLLPARDRVIGYTTAAVGSENPARVHTWHGYCGQHNTSAAVDSVHTRALRENPPGYRLPSAIHRPGTGLLSSWHEFFMK